MTIRFPCAGSTEFADQEVGDKDPLAGTAYRTLGVLGRGGIGVVVEAEHVALRKRVVVKLLRRALADRPDLVDRMRVEAQAQALLSRCNDHIVDVTDFGQTAQGRTFLVMERLFGRTLKDELGRRGAIPIIEAVDWTRQALTGLHAAHEAGLVHRDVKLDNLFLCDFAPGVAGAPARRVVKVLDFGIAKVTDRSTITPPDHRTQEGSLMGTPRFLSPEQAQGSGVDRRTDVYGAGMVLYALLAGRGPFFRLDDPVSLLRAHAFEPPAPVSHLARQPIPPSLDAIVLKAIAKAPDERFASAAQLAAVLTDFAERFAACGHVGNDVLRTVSRSMGTGSAVRQDTARATTEHTQTAADRAIALPAAPPPAPAQRALGLRQLFVAVVVASTGLFTAAIEFARRLGL